MRTKELPIPESVKIHNNQPKGAKSFSKLLRKGMIYTTALALGFGITATSTSITDYMQPKLPAWMWRAPAPPKGWEVTETQLLYNEAKQVADSSYAQTGKYDLDSLRAIQDQYFQYLKDTGVSSEQPIHQYLPLIRQVVDDEVKVNDHDGEIDAKIVKDMLVMTMASIMSNESWGWKYAVGKDGELGLMQPDPNKHKLTKYQEAHIFDPDVNIPLGAKILNEYLVEFHYDVAKAIEAYNGGPGSIYHGKANSRPKKYLNNAMKHINNME